MHSLMLYLLFWFFSSIVFTINLGFSQALANEEEDLSPFFAKQFELHTISLTAVKSKTPIDFSSNRLARKYKTRVKQAYEQAKEPNFADHYFVPRDIGCGTGCSMIFAIDWNSGKIFRPPRDDAFEIQRNSTLLIAKPYTSCTAYGPPILYEFNNHSFRPLPHNKCQK